MSFEHVAHPRKRAFLAAYAETGIVKAAAKASGVSRETHYDWNASDPEYAAAFVKAGQLAGDALEDEARRRAFLKSDKLLMFLLAALKPEKFGKKLVHSGALMVSHGIDLTAFTDEELATLARLADKAGAARSLPDPAGDPAPETP